MYMKNISLCVEFIICQSGLHYGFMVSGTGKLKSRVWFSYFKWLKTA